MNEYWRNLLKRMFDCGPVLLIYETRFNTEYYHCETQTKLFNICLNIIASKYNSGEFNVSDYRPDKPELSLEDAQKQFTGATLKYFENVWAIYNNEMSQIESDNDFYLRVESIVANNKSNEAFFIAYSMLDDIVITNYSNDTINMDLSV